MRGRPHRFCGLAVPGGRVVAVVAALQFRSPAFRRRMSVRRHRGYLAAAGGSLLALLVGLILTVALGVASTSPASPHSFTFNPRPPRPKPPPPTIDVEILVQARGVDYDYT